MHASPQRGWTSYVIYALLIFMWLFVLPIDTLQATSVPSSNDETSSIVETSANANMDASAPTAALRQGTQEFGNDGVQSRLILETGYRRDELDWSIAGRLWNYPQGVNVFVNVLSELKWQNLDIFQVRLSNETLFADHYFFRFSFSRGTIYDGDNQDSDYKGNDRTEEWSRSNNSADEGDVRDMSVATGYRFNLLKKKISLTPLLGYSYHEQNLVMTDGYQTVSEPDTDLHLNPPEVGAFDGLNSSYDARWRGPWLGVDACYELVLPRPSLVMTFGLGLEYHWVDYSASANWNLRSDLAHPESFEHEAAGTGFVMAAKWRCQFPFKLGLNLRFDYQDWSTNAGTDRVYSSTGEVAETRLNEVNWTSQSLLVGVDYPF